MLAQMLAENADRYYIYPQQPHIHTGTRKTSGDVVEGGPWGGGQWLVASLSPDILDSVISGRPTLCSVAQSPLIYIQIQIQNISKPCLCTVSPWSQWKEGGGTLSNLYSNSCSISVINSLTQSVYWNLVPRLFGFTIIRWSDADHCVWAWSGSCSGWETLPWRADRE